MSLQFKVKNKAKDGGRHHNVIAKFNKGVSLERRAETGHAGRDAVTQQ